MSEFIIDVGQDTTSWLDARTRIDKILHDNPVPVVVYIKTKDYRYYTGSLYGGRHGGSNYLGISSLAKYDNSTGTWKRRNQSFRVTKLDDGIKIRFDNLPTTHKADIGEFSLTNTTIIVHACGTVTSKKALNDPNNDKIDVKWKVKYRWWGDNPWNSREYNCLVTIKDNKFYKSDGMPLNAINETTVIEELGII